MNAAFFYIAGAIAVASTVMVITRLNAVHALLYLIVSFFSIAVVLYTLGAPFVAALEVIIYAGAIMVLFVFVIMFFNLGQASIAQEREWLEPSMWIGPSVLALILLAEFIYIAVSGGPARLGDAARAQAAVRPKEVGISLYTTYLLGVELASMLLLAGLVGAYYLGRKSDMTAVRLAPRARRR
ncbi:MAG: NADH-quinone oxidoreductase subunit J [Acidobacteriota bacterium]